jgi:nucleoside-diphosphate-sugar epimerase
MSTQSSTEKDLTVAILGANGLLGSDLVKYLRRSFKIQRITRENYQEKIRARYDVLINANGNSKRYWANQNVLKDFEASTFSVYKTLFDFKFNKYIYISSSDVYPDHSGPSTTKEKQKIDSDSLSPYGLHKYLSEKIVANNTNDYLVLRSCMILGQNLNKGPIFDIIQKQDLFITLETRLQMIHTREIANIIAFLIRKDIKREVYNMGGRGVFNFGLIRDYTKREINISENAKTQFYEMDVEKLNSLHPLKTSKEYFDEYIKEYDINL